MKRNINKLIPYEEGLLGKGRLSIIKQRKRPFKYLIGKKQIDVLLWVRWPSYDFIFGIPAKTNPLRGKEAGFFQYRDVRHKKVIKGFYFDKEELRCLIKGFQKIKKAAGVYFEANQ